MYYGAVVPTRVAGWSSKHLINRLCRLSSTEDITNEMLDRYPIFPLVSSNGVHGWVANNMQNAPYSKAESFFFVFFLTATTNPESTFIRPVQVDCFHVV